MIQTILPQKRPNYSLFVRLIFVIAIFAIIIILSNIFVHRILVSHLRENAQNCLIQAEQVILSQLRESETLAGMVAQDIQEILVRGGSASDVRRYIDKTSAMLENKATGYRYSSMHVYLEKTGTLVPASDWQAPPPKDYVAAERPWYQTAINHGDKIVASPVYKSAKHGGYQFSYVCRMFDDRDRPLGIIAVNIDIDNISQNIVVPRITGNGYGILANEHLELLAHPDVKVIAKPLREISQAGKFTADIFDQGHNDITEMRAKDYFGFDSIVFAKRMENGWHIGISVPIKEYSKDFAFFKLLISVLGLALMVMMCAIFVTIDVANAKTDKVFHEKNSQLALMAQRQVVEEYIQIMLDSSPLVANIWNKDFQNIYSNKEAVKLFGLSSKQEFVDRFYDLSPERQPDGALSSEKVPKLIKEAFEKGYCRFEWMHQKLDGEPLPCEVTLVRTTHGDDYIVAAYTRDLREMKTAIANMQNAIDEKNAMDYLSNIFNALETMIFVSDPTTNKILFANNSLIKEFGIDADSIVGQKCYSALKHGREDRCEYCPYTQLDKESDESVVWEEYDPVTKHTYRSHDSYINWPNGQRLHMQQSVDVTDYKNLLTKTKYMSDYELMKYTLTRDALGIGLWDMEIVNDDPVKSESKILYSREFCQMLGFTDDTDFPNVLGSWSDRLHPDDKDKALEAFAAHICDRSGDTPFDIEYRLMHKNGTYRTYSALGSTQRGKDGTPLRVAGALEDITEKKQLMTDLTNALESETEANRRKDAAVYSLTNILDRIDALIFAAVPETGELLFVNEYGKTMLGKTSEELVGEPCYKVFRGMDKICEFCPCHKLDKDPDSIIVWDRQDTARNGRWFRNSDLYLDWHSGAKVHLQHGVDITELVAAREMAEQSNSSKSIFLAHMSHEIRTPMNAILGTSAIYLRDKHISAYAKEGFSQIIESGDLLLNIINDVLDLSKIEAGKLEIVSDKYQLPSMINDTIQLFRLRYESKPVDFKVVVDEDTPLEFIGDELRIKQVLNNLLSNAFKYSQSGEVELHVSSEPAQDSKFAVLVIRVNDTGQGMNESQLARLFDEYSRFNMKENRNIVGTGLGMNITKRIIAMMDGEIIVKSEVAKGTQFTVRIPQKMCTSLVCGEEISRSLLNFDFQNSSISKFAQITFEYMPYGKILVVDDVASNLFVAVGLMTPFGLQIDTANSGFEAIDQITHGAEYDIIFMDHMMPKMDGIATTQILRKMGYAFPIVALTANVVSGQQSMFLANGFDGFLSKPIDIRELDALLTGLIRDKQPPEVIEAARRERRDIATMNEFPPPGDDNEVVKYFVLDVKNAINTLNPIVSKLPTLDDADLESYIIATHSMKSALANINEKKLSDFAHTLEEAGINRNIAAITNKTPAFFDALQALLRKFKLEETDSGVSMSDQDIAILREKLTIVKDACAKFDVRVAKTALAELKEKNWPRGINNAMDEISLHLLRGEFNKVLSFAENIILQLP